MVANTVYKRKQIMDFIVVFLCVTVSAHAQVDRVQRGEVSNRKRCLHFTYMSKSTGHREPCLRLCNRGGGQMELCEKECGEYITCIDRSISTNKNERENMASKSGLPPYAIVLIVISCSSVLVLTVVFGVRFYRRRSKKDTRKDGAHGAEEEPMTSPLGGSCIQPEDHFSGSPVVVTSQH